MTLRSTPCQLAGIENLHWHDLRHTFGTRLADAGDVYVVKIKKVDGTRFDCDDDAGFTRLIKASVERSQPVRVSTEPTSQIVR